MSPIKQQHTKIPASKKINIIFDLDATLISSNMNFTKYGNKDPEWNTQSIGPHQSIIIPGPKLSEGQESNLLYYRSH